MCMQLVSPFNLIPPCIERIENVQNFSIFHPIKQNYSFQKHQNKCSCFGLELLYT